MNTYLLLLRGVNVGGKNKVSMTELKDQLVELGYTRVSTYINSGNVIVESERTAKIIKAEVKGVIKKGFKLDSEIIKVLVLSQNDLQNVVENKPKGFGDQPDVYHSDVIFLMDISMDDALAVFDPRDGVDTIWTGKSVIYSQRLSAERTRSRLNKIVGTKAYLSMTVRNWNTVTKLLALMIVS